MASGISIATLVDRHAGQPAGARAGARDAGRLISPHGWERRAACRCRHQDHGRRDPGPAAVGGRRQGPVHQGDRQRASRRRHRSRRPFRQGPADARCRTGSRSPATCRARMCATPSSAVAPSSLARSAARRASSAPPPCAGRRRCDACGPISQVTLLRGNVQTRLAKLERGEVDATLLAMAGLRRLGLDRSRHRRSSTRDDFLPAVGQGAIAITIRAGDDACRADPRSDSRSGHRACARRRARLPDRSRRLLPHADRRPCATGRATRIEMRGLVLRPDGSEASSGPHGLSPMRRARTRGGARPARPHARRISWRPDAGSRHPGRGGCGSTAVRLERPRSSGTDRARHPDRADCRRPSSGAVGCADRHEPAWRGGAWGLAPQG